jgi:hypothetical protein
VIVAEGAEGRVLGILGGLPVRVHAAGRTVVVSQVVEAMLDPDIRRGLRKAGLFVTLLAALVEETMTVRGAAFMFALPNQDSDGIHRTVDARFFHQVSRVVRPLTGLGASPAAWLSRTRYSVRRLPDFGPEADQLWERCREGFPLATIRDREYLRWRYRDCPLVQYHAYLAWDRRRDGPAGLAVLRMGWEGQPVGALVDWLVPRDDTAPAALLLAHAERQARRAGLREMAAWFFPGCPEERWFVSRGYRVEPTSYPLVVRATNPDFPPDWIAQHWYYTMGDSDIF